MYDKKVEGITDQERSGMKTEKNYSYFFNLERRNIKKHIRKLQLSGLITIDPFEICEEFFLRKTNSTFVLKTCLLQNFHMNQDLSVKG